MGYGRYFEELAAGQQFRHWPGRTITEFDDTLFSLLSMNQHPVHNDEHYAAGTQHGKRLVVGPLVIGLVIAGVSLLGNIPFLGPIFIGVFFFLALIAGFVMTLVLLTQYLDTLKEIGASANTNTLMLSHAPGEMKNLRDQISQAIAVGDLISDNVGKKP